MPKLSPTQVESIECQRIISSLLVDSYQYVHVVFDEIIHSDQGSTKVYAEEDEQNITLEKVGILSRKNNRLIL